MEGEPKGSGEIKPLDSNTIAEDLQALEAKVAEAVLVREREEEERLSGHLVNHQTLVDNQNKIHELLPQAREVLTGLESDLERFKAQEIVPGDELTGQLERARGMVRDLEANYEEILKQAKEVLAEPGVEGRITDEAEKDDKEFDKNKQREQDREEQEQKNVQVKEMEGKALKEMATEIEKFKIFFTSLMEEYREEEVRVKSLADISEEASKKVHSFEKDANWKLVDESKNLLRDGKTLDEVREVLKNRKRGWGLFGYSKKQHQRINRVRDFLPTLLENIEAESARVQAHNEFYTGSGWSGWEGLRQPIQELEARAVEYDEKIQEFYSPREGYNATRVRDSLFQDIRTIINVVPDYHKKVVTEIISSIEYSSSE